MPIWTNGWGALCPDCWQEIMASKFNTQLVSTFGGINMGITLINSQQLGILLGMEFNVKQASVRPGPIVERPKT